MILHVMAKELPVLAMACANVMKTIMEINVEVNFQLTMTYMFY